MDTDFKKETEKKCLLGYLVLCVIYLVAMISVPHDKLVAKGLEGVGKPSLALQTQEITEETELLFQYEIEGEILEDISFYFTANGQVFSEGNIRIRVYDENGQNLLGEEVHQLEDLKEEAFWGVSLTKDRNQGKIQVEILAENVSEGPAIWLNTEVETPAVSMENGQVLERNLIYNAIYTTQVHYYKQPLVQFAMLVLLGLMAYAVSDRRIDAEAGASEDKDFPLYEKCPGQAKKCFWQNTWECLRIFYGKYRIWLGLCLLAAIVGLVFYHVYDVQIYKAMNTTHRVVVMKDNYAMLPITEETSHFQQHYITEEEELVGLGVRMDLAEGFAASGTITASVTDLTLGELLCSTQVSSQDLLDGQYVGMIFNNSQSNIKGHEYLIELVFSPELYDSGLSVFVTPEGFYEENTLLINGTESDQRLSMNAHEYFNFFLKKYFFGMFVFFELFAVVFYWAVFIRKWKIEKVFLLTILCLGVVYNFLIVPYMTPDEKYHIDMSYRHSNVLLGIDTAGENKCWKRTDDAEISFTSEPSLTNYKLVYDGLFSSVQDETLIEADATANTQAPMIVYLPAVLGMTLARLLHLGTVPMMLLARWCSLLCFALLTYLGMKRLPFGKATLFLLTLLPMNLQQCTSFSYDAVISGVIILYTCYCLSLTYGEEPVKAKDILVMGLLAIVMIYGKSGVYLPVCFLVLLIPVKKFSSRKVQLFSVACLFALPILSFLNKNTATVSQIVTTTEATATVGSSTTAGYTIGYFLKDPWEFVSMIMSTVTDKLGFYLQSVVGQKMGWVEIEISEAIPIFFIVLLVLSVCKTKEEPFYVKTWHKWWIAFVCAASFGIILVGMLLTWTPMGNVSIEGVQGRYFLPLLPAFMLVGRNKMLTFEKNPERGLMYCAFIGQLLAIMFLIKAVLVIR